MLYTETGLRLVDTCHLLPAARHLQPRMLRNSHFCVAHCRTSKSGPDLNHATHASASRCFGHSAEYRLCAAFARGLLVRVGTSPLCLISCASEEHLLGASQRLVNVKVASLCCARGIFMFLSSPAGLVAAQADGVWTACLRFFGMSFKSFRLREVFAAISCGLCAVYPNQPGPC